jgi:presequence protease
MSSPARIDDRERFARWHWKNVQDWKDACRILVIVIVNQRLRAKYSEAGWAAEQMGGVSYLFFLRDLIEQIDQDWDNVCRCLPVDSD